MDLRSQQTCSSEESRQRLFLLLCSKHRKQHLLLPKLLVILFGPLLVDEPSYSHFCYSPCMILIVLAIHVGHALCVCV